MSGSPSALRGRGMLLAVIKRRRYNQHMSCLTQVNVRELMMQLYSRAVRLTRLPIAIYCELTTAGRICDAT